MKARFKLIVFCLSSLAGTGKIGVAYAKEPIHYLSAKSILPKGGILLLKLPSGTISIQDDILSVSTGNSSNVSVVKIYDSPDTDKLDVELSGCGSSSCTYDLKATTLAHGSSYYFEVTPATGSKFGIVLDY